MNIESAKPIEAERKADGAVVEAVARKVESSADEAEPSEAVKPLEPAATQRPEPENVEPIWERYDFAEIALVWGIRTLALLVGLFAWHWVTENSFNWYINFENVPSPTAVWASFVSHLATSEFYIHVLVSMKRILIGYLFAVFLGVLLGVAMGRSWLARNFLVPYIEILRPIPAVAWIPMAILMWPTEESSIIYITFLGALFPIVLNTVHGVEQAPDVLIRAARSLGANTFTIFWHVVLPAALPSIAAGLAIGMGVSWFSLLAGEIISGQYGIGYFTWDAYSLINYPDIVVGMLVIGGLGTLSTYAVRMATQPFLKWQGRAK